MESKTCMNCRFVWSMPNYETCTNKIRQAERQKESDSRYYAVQCPENKTCERWEPK